MGGSDEYKSSGIPSWQKRDQSEQPSSESSSAAQGPSSNSSPIEVARRFLQDDEIKDASRERKLEFLKTKGLDEADIEKLLGPADTPTTIATPAQDEQPTQSAETPAPPAPPAPPTPQASAAPQSSIAPDFHDESPPVITYPEFLTKPTRPPPLVTGTALLNTLYACAGLTTLLYGTSQYVVAPMVASLTAARVDLHATTSDKLAALVRKLEATVSELPAKAPPKPDAAYADDTGSEAEDPTELFHRDVGVQTSLPSTPGGPLAATPAAATPAAAAPEAHARRLADLTASLRGLKDAYVTQSEDLVDVKTAMDLLKDDLGQLTFPSAQQQSDFVGGFSLYGSSAGRKEPEDEIKKAKDNIRRVKGVMLSTRNFPASSR
ncbi:hypothetical protein VD0002_g2966 [Verticillium dahliae]|uniref:Peroxisomal membrane protein PEX14 n=2 Tax=Verticillium dahliae TaxID=27337 RepID=G2WSW1_VERDV|nr:uncharacterized protein VDAG_00884 [Verticillium dahliae VdLs.17]KAH6701704.1 peroxisomal membrane anchor protein conserved region-domain-containing protein [Verticillium dahliae]EGY17202.1 hypothetical protein VDAG_00884 [Verticillium dahliae VdLs.17]PNH32558.1 hypothetical protein BJF96_g4217 [Verticillium dahliae]PNH53409.1 hypothetical protein VD0003_g4031 [Verticillium dahliae]PNH66349.1 hypothetical protein VD0002_g2966 [Verticillium dahliae]